MTVKLRGGNRPGSGSGRHWRRLGPRFGGNPRQRGGWCAPRS